MGSRSFVVIGGRFGMFVVGTIARIRRAHFVQGKSIELICRELRVSRKVVRQVLRLDAIEFRYGREAQPLPRIGSWRDELTPIRLKRRRPYILVNPVLDPRSGNESQAQHRRRQAVHCRLRLARHDRAVIRPGRRGGGVARRSRTARR